MINNNRSEFLCFADTVPAFYPTFYKRLENMFKEYNISFHLLPGTRDVWVRDFMPVQISNTRFVQFRYQPSYLMKSLQGRRTITDVDAVCAGIGLTPEKSDIVLDGGNVIRYGNKVILTERIFSENPNDDKKNLLFRLQDLLEAEEICLVPEQPDDFTGHADGMVRFLDEYTVLVNDFSEEGEIFRRDFNGALRKAKLEYIPVPRNVKNNTSADDATGEYINYLELSGMIILPAFGMREDEEAQKLFRELFPKRGIVNLRCDEPAKDGGLLNCISWNIFKNITV